ncbi:MAG: (d)CMP kinase [Vicinamibacteria bacterium]
MSRPLVIAIDGPSGAGKSTAGRALAARLGYVFVDTGAMYRALAWKALRAHIPLEDGDALARLAHATRIDLMDGGRGVSIDGEDATAAIRTREVSAAASRVSVHPAVRREMVARQREMGERGGIVLDGRDIGTAVFPTADVKFYVDADPGRRARRRAQELGAAGSPFDLAAIERDIRDRDHADMTRRDSPLTRAPDAIHVDTTDLTPEQVVEGMLAAVASKQPA